MARMVELVVAIGVDGARDAVAEIQKLEGAVVKSAKVTENLGQASSTAGKQTTDALGIAGASAYKFGQQWQQVMSSIGTATVAATAVIGGIKTAISWAEEGAQIEYASSKFDRLANSIGTTGDALRKDLVVASRGVKSNLELTAMASEVMSLKLAKNHDDVVRLANVASALNMNMNQLTLSLANQSTQRLDQLGLSAEAVTTKMEALKATGMDDGAAYFEAFISAAEEAIKVQGHVADSALGNFERLKAATSDYFTLLKTEFAEDSPISKWAGGLADMVQKATGDIENKKIIEMGVEMGAISGLEGWNALVGTPYQRELVAKFVQEYIDSMTIATGRTKGWTKENEQLGDTFTDLASAIVDYKTQLADATSIGKNFSAIVGYAKTYDAVITDLNAKEAEYARLRNLGWSETSQKMQTLNGEIEGLKGQLTASANQMTLDMMQATIAIGGVTEAEMGAYFDMAVAMGAVSRQGADAAMAAYQNAVDQINAYALDPKTMIIDVQANALNMVLAELEAERLRDLIVNFKANTEPISDARTQLENAETLEITAEFMVDQLGFREEVSAIEAEEFLATIGLKGDTTQFDKSLKLALDLVPKELTVWLKGEWMGISDPPLPSGAYSYRGGYLSPDKAIGGPVYPGKSYLWQEPGREGELLIPEKYGRVMSNVEVAQAMREALIMSASANSGQGNTTTTNSNNNVTYNVHAMYKEEPVLTLSEHLRIMATLEGRA